MSHETPGERPGRPSAYAPEEALARLGDTVLDYPGFNKMLLAVANSCHELPGVEAFAQDLEKQLRSDTPLKVVDLWDIYRRHFPFNSEAGVVPFLAGRRVRPYRLIQVDGLDPTGPEGIVNQVRAWNQSLPDTQFSVESDGPDLRSLTMACKYRELRGRPQVILFFVGVVVSLLDWTQIEPKPSLMQVEFCIPRPPWASILEDELGVPVSYGHPQTRLVMKTIP